MVQTSVYRVTDCAKARLRERPHSNVALSRSSLRKQKPSVRRKAAYPNRRDLSFFVRSLLVSNLKNASMAIQNAQKIYGNAQTTKTF